MRINPTLFFVLGATLLFVSTVGSHAAEGKYYDPANVASPKGNTVGYELFKTIGCPGKQLLDAGCPDLDSDRDGVLDSKDRCPNTPKGHKVNAEGCELDSDGDGIVDANDKCPNVPAPGTKDGCPPDGDGDGVADALDKCPSVPAPGTKDGCPVDSDGDGIPDNRDKCPAVPAPGTADGCPIPVFVAAPAPRKLVLEGVNFDNDRATMRPEAYSILDKAAATLREWGDVSVEVAGHTDSRSSDDYNQALSQRRAETVRSYLITRGVAANRLSAKGYGESQPLADNDTEEGRFKNRRVELVPQQ